MDKKKNIKDGDGINKKKIRVTQFGAHGLSVLLYSCVNWKGMQILTFKIYYSHVCVGAKEVSVTN